LPTIMVCCEDIESLSTVGEALHCIKTQDVHPAFSLPAANRPSSVMKSLKIHKKTHLRVLSTPLTRRDAAWHFEISHRDCDLRGLAPTSSKQILAQLF
jgi:hypothetical protein